MFGLCCFSNGGLLTEHTEGIIYQSLLFDSRECDVFLRKSLGRFHKENPFQFCCKADLCVFGHFPLSPSCPLYMPVGND